MSDVEHMQWKEPPHILCKHTHKALVHTCRPTTHTDCTHIVAVIKAAETAGEQSTRQLQVTSALDYTGYCQGRSGTSRTLLHTW